MATFCTLGLLVFDLIEWQPHTVKYTSDWTQHQRIKQKPRLEPAGDALNTVSINLSWHVYFIDPALALDNLLTAQRVKKPMPLVFGNGDHKGWYVITEVEDTPLQTLADGTVLCSSARVSLLEYVGKVGELPEAPAMQRAGTPLAARLATQRAAGPGPLALLRPAAPKVLGGLSALRMQALGLIAQARNGINAVKSGLAFAKALQHNPLAALAQLPNLVTLAGQCLPAASGLSSVLHDLAPLAAGGAALLPVVGTLLHDVRSATTLLRRAQQDNSTAHLGSALTSINGALDAAGQLAAPMQQWLLSGALRIGGV
jgi:phage protein U